MLISRQQSRYRPRDYVRALESGLAEPQRSRRPLLMLQSFIDDSGWDGQSPVFVLAGYVAQEKQWEDFSDAWQVILDLKQPKEIKYLKMSQAYQLRHRHSQFYGWSEAERD